MKYEPSPEGSMIVDAVSADAQQPKLGRLTANQVEGGAEKAEENSVGFHFGYVAVGPRQGGYQVAVALGDYRVWATKVHGSHEAACAQALNAYQVPAKPEHEVAGIHMLVNAMVARGWESLGMSFGPDDWAYFPLRRRS